MITLLIARKHCFPWKYFIFTRWLIDKFFSWILFSNELQHFILVYLQLWISCINISCHLDSVLYSFLLTFHVKLLHKEICFIILNISLFNTSIIFVNVRDVLICYYLHPWYSQKDVLLWLTFLCTSDSYHC